MIIRLNERLNITEEQKLELTNMLFSFLKKIKENEEFRNLTAEELASCWIRCVKKPEWMEEKIETEIEFVAGICEFINTYKDELNGKEIEEIAVEPKMSLNEDAFEFLKAIAETKGLDVDIKEEDRFDRKKLLDEIDKAFYINNKNDTLGDPPFEQI